jgi:hypothetical protein
MDPKRFHYPVEIPESCDRHITLHQSHKGELKIEFWDTDFASEVEDAGVSWNARPAYFNPQEEEAVFDRLLERKGFAGLVNGLSSDDLESLAFAALKRLSESKVKAISKYTYSLGEYRFVNVEFPDDDEARILWTAETWEPLDIAILSFCAAMMGVTS